MTFEEIIDNIRTASLNERDKGARFEKLVKLYFTLSPEYKPIVDSVWLWSEFPYRAKLVKGGQDVGIDIVVKTINDEYWAIQCKFYNDSSKVKLEDVTNFIVLSSVQFATETDDKKHSFDKLFWIDVSDKELSSHAADMLKKKGVIHLGLFDLKSAGIDWEAALKNQAQPKVKYALRPHQREAFDKTIEYFKTHDRGKLIMACGTGKTFTSLRIAEEMAKSGSHLVLFLVPSIALLSQTLKEWTSQPKTPYTPSAYVQIPQPQKRTAMKC